MLKKFLLLFALAVVFAVAGYAFGLTAYQSVIVGIFMTSILGSLFFWDFRLSFVFIGSALFLLIKAVNLEEFIRFASLDVIIFLMAMMIIVGMMKDAGFFAWLLTILLRIKDLNGRKLFVIVMVTSAIFSALMGEVASIMVMVTTILNMCYFLEVAPVPLIICSVLATNIGSAATVLGNPVGVLIAARSGLSFEDFLVYALPMSALNLLVIIGLLCFWYRDYIREISVKLKEYNDDQSFHYLISIPPDFRTRVSILIFAVTIFLISLHHRLELLLELKENTLLVMFPLLSAGVVLLYRHEKARHYVEHEVEWSSILFFLFLFAQAGVIQATGIAAFGAEKIIGWVGLHLEKLYAIILFSSGMLSSSLDNVVAVASYMPIIKSLEGFSSNLQPLWWALLFGACYGGNITLIGSTANIVALGLLEKELNIRINFMEWLKIGALVGFLTMIITLLVVLVTPFY